MQKSVGRGFVVVLALACAGAPAASASDDALRSAPCQPAPEGANEVVFLSGGQETPLPHRSAGVRATHPVLGMGDMAIYAVFDGDAAAVRFTDSRPTFHIALPAGGLQPEYKFVLSALAVRPNGTREILVGRGFVNTPTDLPMDRRLRTTQVRAADQTRAPSGYAIYEVTPQTSLAPGEYALVIYDREDRDSSPRNRRIADRFYDFGIDRAR